jgi:ribonuclease D
MSTPAEGNGVPLLEPRDGLPDVVADPILLERTIAMLATGAGPVAVDAERASGYRYGQRAFLIQLRRGNAGTALIDPIACPNLSRLGDALADAEWVLHAAQQDIPCLVEVGLRPRRLFDTELAARLLGLPRVGLAPLIENVLGYSLDKGHAAVDWSTRPLPKAWLRYAALDVELLLELRDVLEARLRETGKWPWAVEEFSYIASAPRVEPRVDPWRRTSGLHQVRSRRGLAIVRELWAERDTLARRRDLAPGRVLPDSAIVEAAVVAPTSPRELGSLPVFRGRGQRRDLSRWFAAVARALRQPDSALPPTALHTPGPPPSRAWAHRDPEAAARLGAMREAVTAVAAAREVPVENLLAPEVLRHIAWTVRSPISVDALGQAMRELGAREWQIALTAEVLTNAVQHTAQHEAH